MAAIVRGLRGPANGTADDFVDLANAYGLKLPTVSNLAPTALYALAVPSTPQEVRDEVELMEIDENLARAELTPAEQVAYVAPRKELWEEKNKEDRGAKNSGGIDCSTRTGGKLKTLGPQHQKAFAAETAAVAGKTKQHINRELRRLEELGDAITQIAHTSLDSGVEMDALIRRAEPERKQLTERAAAGEKVIARPAKPVPTPNEPRTTLIARFVELYTNFTDEEKEIALIKINARREE